MFKKKYKAQVLAIVIVVLFIATIIGISLQNRRNTSISSTIASRASIEADEVIDGILNKLTTTDLSRVLELFRDKEKLEEDRSAGKTEITDFLSNLGIENPFDNNESCSLDIEGNKYVLSLSTSNNDVAYEISAGQSWVLPINNGFDQNSSCKLDLRIQEIDSSAGFRILKTYAQYDENGQFLGYKSYDYNDSQSYCLADVGGSDCRNGSLLPNTGFNWTKYSNQENLIFPLMGANAIIEKDGVKYQLDDINVKAVNGRIGILYSMVDDDGNDCSAGYGIRRIVLEAYCNGTYSGKEVMIPERDWYDSIFDYTLFNGSGSLGADMTSVDKRSADHISVSARSLFYTGDEQTLVTVSGKENCNDLYFSLDTVLNASNYTSGTTSIPVGKDIGTYEVYYYCSGNNNYRPQTGSTSVKIEEHNFYACRKGILLSECLILSDYPGDDYTDEADLHTKSVNNIKDNKHADFNYLSTIDEGLNVINDYLGNNENGETYYYRGSVNDNWVSFAGYAWRVVRINSDGSIRLIFSGNITKENNNEKITGPANIGSSMFNSNQDDEKYLGYMYDGNIDSTVKGMIDNWYASKIYGQYEGYLSNGIFCNDRNRTKFEWPMKRYYFDRYSEPSLACRPEDSFSLKVSGKSSLSGDSNYGNSSLEYPIGLLTADEVIMAGGIAGTQNEDYYLADRNNAYWLGTPSTYYSWMFNHDAEVLTVGASGELLSRRVNEENIAVRPVINLNNSVVYVDGNGTSHKPFIVGLANPISVSANDLTYTGAEQILVKTTNNKGSVYYSLGTPLNDENYKTAGSTALPVATDAKSYTVYWYCEGDGTYVAVSGQEDVTIKRVNVTLLIDPRSVASLFTSETGTFTATVKSAVDCLGIITAYSNPSFVSIISETSKGVTATSGGQNVSFTYQGVGATNGSTTIEVLFTTSNPNFIAPEPQSFTIRKIEELNRDDNPITVNGINNNYSRTAYELVVTKDAQGEVYYSTETPLNSGNYKTKGSTTVPSATNAGDYTIYWYCEGNRSYNDASGQVRSTINKIVPTFSIDPKSISSLILNDTGTVTATVESDVDCLGTITASSNPSFVSIVSETSKSVTATRDGQSVSFTYMGVSVSDAQTIMIWFEPSDGTNFEFPDMQIFTVSSIKEKVIEKQNNPISVTGNSLTYTGSSQGLVTTSNAQGSVYYSTSTQLNESNYSSVGSTINPRAINAGGYTVYWYCEGNDNYKPASGQVRASIGQISPTLSINPSSVTSLSSGSPGSFTATVTSTVDCAGELTVASKNSNVVRITSGTSNIITATSDGYRQTITFSGVGASNQGADIVVTFTPSNPTNFVTPASQVFSVKQVGMAEPCVPGDTLAYCLIYADYGDRDYDAATTAIKNKPARDFNASANTDEGLHATADYSSISSTTLDGTSYYYRGAVPDNWVSFAGYLWRVVRVNGDGSVRMIYSGTASNHTGEGTQIGTSVFSPDENNIKNMAYIYDASTSSTVKTYVDNWYVNNLKANYEGYLANEMYCYDRTYVVGGRDNAYHYYGSYQRLSRFDGHIPSPTLECKNKADRYTLKVSGNSSIAGTNGAGNNLLEYPIALLTADESAFAGGRILASAYNYLYTSYPYWLGSPDSHWIGSYYDVFIQHGYINTAMLGGDYLDEANGVRPVINLRADVLYSSGNGTENNPYVVELNNSSSSSGSCQSGDTLSNCLIYADYGDRDYTAATTAIKNKARRDFSKAATTDEGLHARPDYSSVSSTSLDGTSYYYRGAVPDNWVSFAGFLWRVVRINGDGSVRMIYSGSMDSSHTGTDAQLGPSVYNRSNNDRIYVGYTYKLVTGSSVTGTVYSDSTVKEYIDRWYENNLKTNYEGYLANEIFCNDRSFTHTTTSTYWYFGAYKRLVDSYSETSGINPRLSCDQLDRYTLKVSGDSSIKGIDGAGNNELNYPVGLLTADEASLAGGIIEASSTHKNYLYTGQGYWLGSPSRYSETVRAQMFTMSRLGNLNYTGIVVGATTYGIRPVINLKSSVLYDGGNGTESNPYTVKPEQAVISAPTVVKTPSSCLAGYTPCLVSFNVSLSSSISNCSGTLTGTAKGVKFLTSKNDSGTTTKTFSVTPGKTINVQTGAACDQSGTIIFNFTPSDSNACSAAEPITVQVQYGANSCGFGI